MTNQPQAGERIRGVPRLPIIWELIVQLIGTFGLAVFLVLYYVLVMQPREQRRYEELRRSVDSVVRLVHEGRTIVTREQAERLKELFILSVAPELARHIERTLSESAPERPVSAAEAASVTGKITESLEEIFRARARLLRGVSRESNGEISELLKATLRHSRVAERISHRAVTDWPYLSRADLERSCRESLYASLRTLQEPN